MTSLVPGMHPPSITPFPHTCTVGHRAPPLPSPAPCVSHLCGRQIPLRQSPLHHNGRSQCTSVTSLWREREILRRLSCLLVNQPLSISIALLPCDFCPFLMLEIDCNVSPSSIIFDTSVVVKTLPWKNLKKRESQNGFNPAAGPPSAP